MASGVTKMGQETDSAALMRMSRQSFDNLLAKVEANDHAMRRSGIRTPR
jgi:hypothetical protein